MDLSNWKDIPVRWNFSGEPIGRVLEARLEPASKQIQVTLQIDDDIALTNYIYARSSDLRISSET